MIKKILFLLVMTLTLCMLSTHMVWADSWDQSAQTVTIDSEWLDGLEAAVIAQLGDDPVSLITTLNITSGTLSDADVMWISRNLINLETLSITGQATFANHSLPDFAFSNTSSVSPPTALASLKRVTIDIVDSSPLTTGKQLLASCKVLNAVSLPTVTTFGDNAFQYCDRLITLSLPAATTIGNYACVGCYQLATLSLPEVTTIGDYAFQTCDALVTLSLPKAITFGSYAFQNCEELTAVTLPEAITFGKGAFERCDAIEALSLPKATTFGDNAFSGCKAMVTLSLPEATTIGDSAFYDCDALETLRLPAAITIGERAFSYCDVLSTIDLPVATTIGGHAFNYCRKLASMSLPEVTTIGNYTFEGCEDLTTVNLPKVETIGNNAFCRCNALTSVSMPQATICGDYLFSKSVALTTIELPSVISIGDHALEGCTKLITLTLGHTPPASHNIFTNYTPIGYNPPIAWVPATAVSNYSLDNAGLWYGWEIRGFGVDVTLADLTVNNVTIANFSPEITTYDLGLTPASSIAIGALASDSNASITGDMGTQSLVYADNTFTITVTAEDGSSSKEYTLHITKGYQLTLTAQHGEITVNPDKVTYMLNEQVDLTAQPQNGYRFTGWSGDINEDELTITVEVTGNMNIEANFERKREDINLDGVCNLIDIQLLTPEYRLTSSSPNFNEAHDINMDGVINIYDLVRIAREIETN